jgi:hypothetical protein
MKTLELHLDEPVAQRLEELATKLGVTTEELVRLSLEEKLERLDDEFQSAADYVLDKNRELYRRLS